MKCADPVLCFTINGLRKYRNFSFIKQHTLILTKASNLVFDCGKCLFCRKKKAHELACKCVLHSSLYFQNCFLTLTYDEKRKGYHNEFEYSDVQKFKKRLRQHCSRHHKGKKIEIFNVHEYGKNGKKHWHLIVFNHDFSDKERYTIKNGNTLYTSDELQKLWPFGFNTIGDVSIASAMYQAQYMEKDFKNSHAGTSKKSHSKHSGIGRPYFLKHYATILANGFIPVNGGRIPVPRSFQRLAERHWAHFNKPSLFFATSERKARFRLFTKDSPDLGLSRAYEQFKLIKAEKILELEKEWNELVTTFVTTGTDPDFIMSASNALYDLRNKTNPERF